MNTLMSCLPNNQTFDINYNSNLCEGIQNDILKLKQALSSDKFKNISIKNLLEISKNKKEYQREFKRSLQSPLYQEFLNLYKKCREILLPFRIIDFVKQGNHLKGSPNTNLTKNDKKVVLKEWETKLLTSLTSDEWELASKITWLHGTNSAILPFLPNTDYCLIPTGKLLEKGLAPYSGEIKRGGMTANGVNQSRLSVVTISNIALCWEYASKISHSFQPLFLENPEGFFCTKLGLLKRMSPEDDEWDPTLISLYQLKQWSPEIFQNLVEKHNEWIREIKSKPTDSLAAEEVSILRVLNYDDNELALARLDKEKWKKVSSAFFSNRYGIHATPEYWLKNLPSLLSIQMVDHLLSNYYIDRNLKIILFKTFYKEMAEEKMLECGEAGENTLEQLKQIQNGNLSSILNPIRTVLEKKINSKKLPYAKRLERLEKLFDKKSLIELSDSNKNEITKPFPFVLASTTLKSSGVKSAYGEYHVLQPKFGKDIDVIFVPNDSLSRVEKWLSDNSLKEKISVHTTEVLQKFMTVPLIHSWEQILLHESYIDGDTASKIHKIVNQDVLKLYQTTYIHGEPRFWHGVSHALRVLLFSHVIGSLYKEAGYSFSKSKAGNLQIAAAMHDCARENDGKDYWDKESGMKCKMILLKNGESESVANLFEKAIAEKDNKSINCLEQKVIHDADCLEIIRCLRKVEDFNPSELWILKDIHLDRVHQLIPEAKLLIKLTDTNKEIKTYIEHSSDPLMCLYQIVFHIEKNYGKMELISEHIQGSRKFFDRPENYILDEKIEKIIKDNLLNIDQKA